MSPITIEAFWEKHKDEWFSVCGRWRVPLRDIWFKGYGRKPDEHVYVVYDNETVLYVGQTTQGVYYRLRHHVSQPSTVGMIIHERRPFWDGIEVEVIQIGPGTTGHRDGWPLTHAEHYFIITYKPTLNVQMNARGRMKTQR